MRFAVIAGCLLLSGASFAQGWQALPEVAPHPPDNPPDEAKVALGKQLFFDPRFSSTGTVSCNSCHNVMAGGDDSRTTSMGVHGLTGPRNAPTVWNAAFHSVQFWDGRAKTLEDQAKGPVVAGVEMGMSSLEAAIERVRQIPGYVAQFGAVFGGEQPVTIDNAAKAVAAYERTLITPNSPFDRYVNGDDSALTEQQVRGMQTFQTLGCVACHRGPAFNGPTMPDGQGFYISFPFHDSPYVEKYGLRDEDGRFAVSGNPDDKHKYRVPTLRNIALTAPYMHDGRFQTLRQVIDHYNEGGHYAENASPNVRLLHFSERDKADLTAFLLTLTDTAFVRDPRFIHP